MVIAASAPAFGAAQVQGLTETVQITGVNTVIIASGSLTATITGTPDVTVSGGLNVNNLPAQQHVLVDNTITTTTHTWVDNQVTISTHVTVDNQVTASTHTWVDNQISVATHTSVDNFPASQAVTGTFWQATQPVSFAAPTVYLATTSIQGAVNVVSTNTLPVSGTVNIISTNTLTVSAPPLRPSQGAGRTYKTGFGDNLTGSTTIYTVTAGKTLYVTSMNISGYNTSTTNAGRLRVQDGAVTVVPVSGPAAGIGAAAASTVMSLAGNAFLEPKQFATALNITVVSGTLTFSFDFTGYEE